METKAVVNQLAALAQETRSAILGTVRDSAGAVVAGATVEVTQTETNSTSKLTTNDSGYFEARYLLPGTYSISVTASGFNLTDCPDRAASKKASRSSNKMRQDQPSVMAWCMFKYRKNSSWPVQNSFVRQRRSPFSGIRSAASASVRTRFEESNRRDSPERMSIAERAATGQDISPCFFAC
mgnify:CR=1 FL=1